MDKRLSTKRCTLKFAENEDSHSLRHDLTHDERPWTETPALEFSPWSTSAAKRIFDCACVVLVFPLLIPIFAMVALAVRITSQGPVLFRQQRMGKMGQSFTILKFRTMLHIEGRAYHAVATVGNRNFTSIGRFLRHWKLDELPQLLNVLLGDMSLVGPRPKLIEHSASMLRWSPGITGAATIAFAREEVALNRVPGGCLDELYRAVVLPAKQRLDDEYMSRATLFTDIRLLISTVLRRWDSSYLDNLIAEVVIHLEDRATPAAPSQDCFLAPNGRDEYRTESAISMERAEAL